MNNVTHGIMPLATLAHIAVESANYKTDGKLALVEIEEGKPVDVLILPFDHLPEIVGRNPRSSTVALLFPDSHDLESTTLREQAELIDQIGRSRGTDAGPWDTVVAYGGVRFRIYSSHGWLDEPELDGMNNEVLDRHIAAFSGFAPKAFPRPFSVYDLEEAHHQWRALLTDSLEGRPPMVTPERGTLEAGSIRDTVIVWAVGQDGNDTLGPRGTFIPPTTPPDPDRINAAFTVLANRVGNTDTVHALGCACYLAWWSGYDRLATHLYYRARATGQRSRLAKLVWTAMTQNITPPWMRF